MSERLSQAEYETLATFRYELRRFLRFSEEAARASGIEPQQHQALLAIRGFPERARLTISELAERLQIRHHSAVGLVGRLVGQGLLERIQNHSDRRLVFVRLTPDGEALLDQLAAAHRAELRRLGPQLATLIQQLTAEADGASTVEGQNHECPECSTGVLREAQGQPVEEQKHGRKSDAEIEQSRAILGKSD
jgi:DNA-binding MarR family transcriptional regulator